MGSWSDERRIGSTIANELGCGCDVDIKLAWIVAFATLPDETEFKLLRVQESILHGQGERIYPISSEFEPTTSLAQ